MLKGVVFDLDGTLIDSLPITFEAFNFGIMEGGGRRHTPDEIARHFGMGEEEIFARILGREKAARAFDACHFFFRENLHKMPLHPGVPELLEQFRSREVPISIFTGRGWTTTEMILKHHGLLDAFVTVISDDHVEESKPAPEGLQKALATMRLEPREALFVGDSAVDIQAARSAGCWSVAALWDSVADREQLANAKPHHWAEQPERIWDLWRGGATLAFNSGPPCSQC